MATVQHQLEQLHGRLNRAGVPPDGCYKRNTVWYPLVSYINTIIALYLSDNYDVIPVFVMRATNTHADIAKEHKHVYLDLVAEYLHLIVTHLRETGFTEEQLAPYVSGVHGDN
ncbi:hypothetical protein FF011L_12410 [Roseimaritima multifibrata]|uniref:Uncharacterized protein n=1 Tax=Roseimaritima multifibrata TaxID=1930274 RepID=A0A517MCD2_9BACT|nr:hypothetical protein [Roseimaritima multifibrata]QDS92496.1 hypothetical protein FF011L_12410 [Roseimaritima multifibrata]